MLACVDVPLGQNFVCRALCEHVLRVYIGLCSKFKHSSAQAPHHRIFWQEETTSISLWEGANRAIEAAESSRETCQLQKFGEEKTAVQQSKDRQKNRRATPAAMIREVSKSSDLQRLSRLLADGKINPACPETFSAALRDGNPAIVEMILHHGFDRHGASFKEAFRAWGDIDVGRGKRRPPRCLPLHSSCHAGSPEILSVLLRRMAKCYSSENRKAMVNTRDLNGRTALHLASWSPRPRCPGKRPANVRSGAPLSTIYPCKKKKTRSISQDLTMIMITSLYGNQGGFCVSLLCRELRLDTSYSYGT